MRLCFPYKRWKTSLHELVVMLQLKKDCLFINSVNNTELLLIKKNEIEKVTLRGKNRERNTQLNRQKRMNVGTNPNTNLI